MVVKLILPKLDNESILWVWCYIYLLSLVFQNSLSVFSQHNKKQKEKWLIILRKVINVLISNFDKILDYLQIFEEHLKIFIQFN
jgi:hypothetical protein